MEKVVAHTDGSSKPNPGIGGWGFTATLIFPDRSNIIFEEWGGDKHTTNSRMEMTGLYKCLKEFQNYNGIILEIYSDSTMCIKALTNKKELTEIILNDDGKLLHGWMEKWFSQNIKFHTLNVDEYWNTKRLNGDLWYKIHQSLLKHQENENTIKIGWVKGHSGNKGNDRADKLSNKFLKNIS